MNITVAQQDKLVKLAMSPHFAYVPLVDAFKALQDSEWCVESASKLLFERFTIQQCGDSYSAVRNEPETLR